MSDEELKQAVDRFLGWPVPDSACADGCATMKGYKHRVGTNFFTADEARQMFEYVFGKGDA